ncbi:MAG: hypothetical protein ACTH8F_09955, partial [Microbacterium sp.]
MSSDMPAASDDANVPAEVPTNDAANTEAPATRAKAATKTKKPSKQTEQKAKKVKKQVEPADEAELSPKPVVEPVPSNRSFWTRI